VLAPPEISAPFRVSNDGIAFEGNISSYLDRETYLFGQYEKDSIDCFLSLVPVTRRKVIFDIGSNVGTHSLPFSMHFGQVHSFEPNPALWDQFERNVALNEKDNVFLHKVGLGDRSEHRPFFSTKHSNNLGMGTFSTTDQYDLPTEQIGVLRVEGGDDYVKSMALETVDAIKIDVQGFEPHVLAGLSGTLRRYRPVVWFEYELGTRNTIHEPSDIRSLFPYPIRIWRIAQHVSLVSRSVRLQQVTTNNELALGEFVVVPVDD